LAAHVRDVTAKALNLQALLAPAPMGESPVTTLWDTTDADVVRAARSNGRSEALRVGIGAHPRRAFINRTGQRRRKMSSGQGQRTHGRHITANHSGHRRNLRNRAAPEAAVRHRGESVREGRRNAGCSAVSGGTQTSPSSSLCGYQFAPVVSRWARRGCPTDRVRPAGRLRRFRRVTEA